MSKVQQISPYVRCAQRCFTWAAGAYSVIAWSFAIYAAPRAPWVPDLYNLINNNERLAKPESTEGYLFIFPIMLTTAFLFSLFTSSYTSSPIPKNPKLLDASILGAFGILSMLLAASIFRALTAASLVPPG